MTEQERKDYCKDCDRSIWGKYHDCDTNIEDNGYYNLSSEKCYCKIINGVRSEKYPWEEQMREFTEEKASYSKALDKMYKSTGFNVFN